MLVLYQQLYLLFWSNFYHIVFQFSFDLSQMPEESTSSGVNWLCHPTAMHSYLSLLGLSQKDATLEASCGALQNLTASKDLVSRNDIRKGSNYFVFLFHYLWFFTQGASAMSQILVQKLGVLAHISSLLKSPNPSLQKNALSLLGNMSRTSSLQTSMGKEEHLLLSNNWFASTRVVDITMVVLFYCLSKAGTAWSHQPAFKPWCSHWWNHSTSVQHCRDSDVGWHWVQQEDGYKRAGVRAGWPQWEWVRFCFYFQCIKTPQPPFVVERGSAIYFISQPFTKGGGYVTASVCFECFPSFCEAF